MAMAILFICYVLVHRSSQTFWLGQGLTDRLVERTYAPGANFRAINTPGAWFDYMSLLFIPVMSAHFLPRSEAKQGRARERGESRQGEG